MIKLTENKAYSINTIVFLVLSLLFLNPISSAEFNCDLEPNNQNELNEQLVVKGTNSLFCIHFLPYFMKLSFKIEVDSYSVVSGKRSFETFQDEAHEKRDVDVLIQLSGSTQYSQQIPFLRNIDELVFPIISILIHTDNGKITSIELEDLKDACQENNIVPEVLPLGMSFSKENKIPLCSQDICKENDNENGICDIKVFVSWEGTDAKGNTMISHSKRILNFAKYNLSNMYDSMREMDNNFPKENHCLLYTSPSPRDLSTSRMPSSA